MAAHDEGPSTSGATGAQADSKQVDPIKQAWKDLAEKVSVAGWKEALSEPFIQIRRMFQIALVVLLITSIYYSAIVFLQWSRSGYKDEIEDIFDRYNLPFSNVTICAQVYLNQTFVMKNVSIPEIIHQRYTSFGLPAEELYRQLTIFLSFISRPHSLDPIILSYFNRIINENPQLEDYSAFLDAASLQCPNMLRRCWFNRVEFDCCSRAVRSNDDDGICYILALNMDSDNAVPSGYTFQQTTPGPGGGLTVEVSVDLEDFPWLEGDADDGFRVYVNPVPYSMIQSPLGAAAGAETFIKVTPAKRHMSFNCTPHGELGQRQSYVYYDPDGVDCMVEGLYKIMVKYVSCMSPSFLFRPNSSIVCNPGALFVALSTFFRSDLDQFYESLTAISRYRFLSALKSLEADWRGAFSDASRCRKHCDRWTYDSSPSFNYLEANESEHEKKRNRMFSRINVYYGELSYRKYQEVKEYSSYLAFYNFGNVMLLYLGMSIVSFFDLLYYALRYCIVRRLNKNRVKPGSNGSK